MGDRSQVHRLGTSVPATLANSASYPQRNGVVPVKEERQSSAAGKVTVGLASH